MRLDDYYCADMKGGKVELQSTVSGDFDRGKTWIFAVDTCSNFKIYTGSNECEDDTIVLDKLKDLFITTKIVYEFYSTDTYADNK